MINIATKFNKNGNRYQLQIDNKNKTYKKGNFIFHSSDVTTTKKDILELIKLLDFDGYKSI